METKTVISGKIQGELKKLQPTGYTQWDIYNVLYDAWAEYRGMIIESPRLKLAEFQKTMQFSGFITVKCKTRLNNVPYSVNILDRSALDESNAIATATEKFKLFYNGVKAESTIILVISPVPFQPHILNYIQSNVPAGTLRRWNYDVFKVVLPIMVKSKYTILSEKEEAIALESLKTTKANMKPIYTSDAMSEWVGFEKGQMILIERISGVAGRAADYRHVVKTSNL